MSKPFIISIDGFGAAGKTTLAKMLAESLGKCHVIEIDDFCYPPSGKKHEWWGNDVKGYGVDWERLRDQVFIPASRGKILHYQALDWDDFTLKQVPEIKGCSLLIIEGLQALRKELREYCDIKVWMDTSVDDQLERVKVRDGDFMIPFWINEFIPLSKAYFDEHRPDQAADVIMEMGDNPEKVLDFIQRKKNDKNYKPACLC